MSIVHVVMFGFKPLATPEEVEEACNRMLDLKQKCIHPKTNQPYVKSARGGTDTSPEQLQNGMTHVFMCEFDSPEDRAYYLEEDPAYASFVKSVEGIIEKKQVVDFCPGKFTTCAR